MSVEIPRTSYEMRDPICIITYIYIFVERQILVPHEIQYNI